MSTILIASPLEAELAARIAEAHPGGAVIHRPDLVPAARYPADHVGAPLVRDPEAEAEWRGLLARADILFDLDWTHLEDLPDLAPQLRWIQASSSGIGPLLSRHRYPQRLPDTVITRASGVHAQPLTEFALMVMLMHARRHDLMATQQRARRWTRFAGTDLRERTVVIIGLGAIGAELARCCAALGMRVVGVGRTAEVPEAAAPHLAGYHPHTALDAVLPEAEFLVLVAPHTAATRGLLGADRLARLPRGAVLVNIARGALVDEPALIAALRSGHLGGAGLDVVADEPLAESSPLWDLPNVLISPHSAGTSDRENARLVELFLDNLARFRAGTPLRNVVQPRELL
ncbi:MAG: D-2-hydroxyacid dehydrogenase [Gemmatimonadetes bacterium]|nr:D-2-hydroxyacid dehydrogenase [Gemmatimonadota bacterium]MCA9762017.1 D-2-hydroxyacid dehydrogenase [Gemmatimonadota bacterium]MCB9519093.1 D-2-hydroxyacid dehydrogenase [Gemmatimonadales bacterium]